MPDTTHQVPPASSPPEKPHGPPDEARRAASGVALQWACVLGVAAAFGVLLFAGGEDNEFHFAGGSAFEASAKGGSGPSPHGGGADPHGGTADPHGIGGDPHGIGGDPHGGGGDPHGGGGDPHGGGAFSMAHLEKQIQNLRQEAAAKPGDAALRVRLANTLFNVAALAKRRGEGEPDGGREKWTEAIGQYTEALKLQESPDVRCDLGTCYFEMGQYDEALREFKNVLAAHPEHANAAFNLAMVCEAKGDIAEAVRQWAELARKQPDTEAGKQAKLAVERLERKK
jgi:hypothetical protein